MSTQFESTTAAPSSSAIKQGAASVQPGVDTPMKINITSPASSSAAADNKQSGGLKDENKTTNNLPSEQAQRDAAIARTEFAKRVIDAQPPSKEELRQGMDKVTENIQQAEQRALSMDKQAGAQTLRDAREVLEATKAIADERSGLIEKTQQLAVESYKAAEEAAMSAKSELEKKEGKVESMAESVKPTSGETREIRSAAERLLSVLKMIVTSGEGRGIMMEFSGLLKQMFRIMGGALDEATDTITKGAVDAARDEHNSTGTTTTKSAEKTVKEVGNKLQEQVEKKKDEVNDTKEQFNETIKNVMSLMSKIVEHPDVKLAVQDLIEIARDYQSRIIEKGKEAKDMAESTASEAKSAAAPHAEKAASLAVEVMKELAPGDLLDQIAQQARDCINLFNDNQTLSNFWENLNQWFNEMLENPELLKKEESSQKLNEFLQECKETWQDVNEEVGPKMNEMWNLLENLFNTLKDDKQLQELQSAVNRLSSDLFRIDASGKPQLKMEAFNDIKSVVAPMVADALRYLAVPPIDYTDKVYDLKISDLVLRADELLPDAIKFYAETMFDVRMSNMSSSHELGRFTIFVRGVKIEAKNFKFFINRKSFPALSDEGHCDFWTSDKGVDIDITFRQQTTHPFLSAPRARCHIDKLNIKLHKDAYHSWLLNIITSVFRGTIERSIEKNVQDAIEKNGLMFAEKINTQLSNWQSAIPSKFGLGDKSSASTASSSSDDSLSASKPSFPTASEGAPQIPAVPVAMKADKPSVLSSLSASVSSLTSSSSSSSSSDSFGAPISPPGPAPTAYDLGPRPSDVIHNAPSFGDRLKSATKDTTPVADATAPVATAPAAVADVAAAPVVAATAPTASTTQPKKGRKSRGNKKANKGRKHKK